MYRSVRASVRIQARQRVEAARVIDGEHLIKSGEVDARQILLQFDDFLSMLGDQGGFGGRVLALSARCSAGMRNYL
jgi:hypothetical protein